MIEHKDLPEGVQIAIEILQNIPEDMLDTFQGRVILNPEKDPKLLWDEIVEEYYKK